MRKFYLKFILLFITLFVLVGLACMSNTPDPTATTAPIVVVEQPTEESVTVQQPTPTNTLVVEQPQPTVEENDNTPPAYYTEEFDGNIDNYSWFMMNGDENLMDLYTDSGRLVFDLQGTYQYVYVLYDPYTYSSVVLDLVAENRGKNTNNVSLVCNYSDRDGWYEFNITNGGLYDILVYSEMDGDYFGLQSGGSTHIVTGRAVNEYSVVCDGNYLALYINGYLEKEVVDNKYNLREGQVGFSVSSFDVTPILVEVDSFTIAQP